jgi:geranylgeranyl diphosphate synthase type I
MVALALEQASAAQRELVRDLLGDPGLDADGVAALQEVLTGTGAVDRVEDLIATRTHEALSALDGAPVAGEAAEVLRELALEATRRTL